MDRNTVNVIFHCLTIVIIFCGSLQIFNEIIVNYLPIGVVLTFGLAGFVYYFRVPAPSKEAVNAILGKDLQDVEPDTSEYVVKTVAHRGAALDAPENTLEAFSMCNEKGCDFIEFDISLTADEIPIVFHDATTDRLTDCDFVINDSKWSTLKNLNLSVKHPFRDRYPQTNIPTLEQTVNQLLADGQKMFIDLKDNDNKMVDVIIDLFDKRPELISKALVTSFYPNLIYFIRRKNPKIVCSLAYRPYSFSYKTFTFTQGFGQKIENVWYKHYYLYLLDVLHQWLLPRITYYFIGLSVILLNKDVIDGKTIWDWRNKGVRVMAWTVNNPIEKQMLAKVYKITYITDTLTGENTTHSTY